MSPALGLEALLAAQAELERELVALKAQGVRPIEAHELEELLTMVKAKASEGGTPVVAFRLDAELLERLQAHAERMSKAMPGVQFSRTDAVRALLLKALEAEESPKDRKRYGGVHVSRP